MNGKWMGNDMKNVILKNIEREKREKIHKSHNLAPKFIEG